MAQFLKEALEAKTKQQNLSELKKSFYCQLCNARSFSNIDIKNQVVYHQEHFCTQLVYTYRSLFMFMHKKLVDLVDRMFQLIHCYETNSNVYAFPFVNFLDKFKQRSQLVVKCIKAVENNDPSVMENCWFICNKYSNFRFTKLLDGDLRLIMRMKLAIFSFIRKFKI